MKGYKLLLLSLFTASIAKAQLIKNSFGESWALNEKILSVKAEVVKREPGWRYGFDVDFDFVFGQESKQKVSYLIQIEKITIRKEKGYFHQGYNDKAGKYHPCSKLNNLCATADINAIHIWAIWEFNGKEFKSGSIGFYNHRDDKSFLKKPVTLTPPGGSGITPNDVKSGAAKVVRVEMASWSFLNTDEIMNMIRENKW